MSSPRKFAFVFIRIKICPMSLRSGGVTKQVGKKNSNIAVLAFRNRGNRMHSPNINFFLHKFSLFIYDFMTHFAKCNLMVTNTAACPPRQAWAGGEDKQKFAA